MAAFNETDKAEPFHRGDDSPGRHAGRLSGPLPKGSDLTRKGTTGPRLCLLWAMDIWAETYFI